MSTDPIVISLSPFKTVAASGQHDVSVPVTVRNLGSKPMTVTTRFTSAQASPATGGRCSLVSPPSWAHVSPASFSLAPGQVEHATVTVNAPASAHGSYDLVAVFAGAPAQSGAGTGLNVSGGVGSRILLSLPGATTAHPCLVAQPPPRAVHAPPGGGLPAISVAGLALLAGLVILAGLAGLRRRIRRRTAARTSALLDQAVSGGAADPDALALIAYGEWRGGGRHRTAGLHEAGRHRLN